MPTNSDPSFNFKNKIWLWSTVKGAWHFITIPSSIGKKIQEEYGYLKAGWGSIKVTASVTKSPHKNLQQKISWETSIFPDKKTGAYFLPIKATVRQKAKIEEGDEVEMEIGLKFAL